MDMEHAADVEVNMELNSFKKQYGISQIREFERMLAQEDISGSFLRTSFIEEGSVLTAIYRYDGYVRASEYVFENEKELLELIRRVIKQVHHASCYYISADRLEISGETVFYRPSDGDVRMAFVLSAGKTFTESILSFCEEMQPCHAGEESEKLHEFLAFLKEKSHGICEMIEKLEAMMTDGGNENCTFG